MAEGWRVAIIGGRPSASWSSPWDWVTRKLEPSSAWAAVAPRQTIRRGRTVSNSASSQGRQAWISFMVGFLWMQLAARFPFEVLDSVGDVNFAAIDFSFLQALVQQFSGRADKGAAFLVFAVSRLLTDHHDGDFRSCRFRAGLQFSKDSLRGVAIEVTSAALLDCFPKDGQTAICGHKRCGTLAGSGRHGDIDAGQAGSWLAHDLVRPHHFVGFVFEDVAVPDVSSGVGL